MGCNPTAARDVLVAAPVPRAALVIEDGRITYAGTAAEAPTVPANARRIDARGGTIMPGLVEAHCHLDKTLHGGPWVPHPAGDALAERIGAERRITDRPHRAVDFGLCGAGGRQGQRQTERKVTVHPALDGGAAPCESTAVVDCLM